MFIIFLQSIDNRLLTGGERGGFVGRGNSGSNIPNPVAKIVDPADSLDDTPRSSWRQGSSSRGRSRDAAYHLPGAVTI